jgi:serine/threonine protein kinase
MNELLSIDNISGNYAIEKEIGRGGMGIVYLATDKRLDRPVAIKVLNLSTLEEYVSDVSEIIIRFNREAKAVAKLSHPNIVSIYDIGYENNLHYMVMEFLEGKVLTELKTPGQLDIKQIANIGIQICSALDFAHQRGIIHRDIKTANIILTPGNSAKLMDFGIAQLNTEGHLRLTREGSVLGSMTYISPEQLMNAKNVDARADIYSLGVTLYELLTGRLPFEGNNVATLIMNILKDKPEPPSKFNNKVPEMLDQIIEKALEKNLVMRYQTAQEFSEDLTNFLNSFTTNAVQISTTNSYTDLERLKLEEELRTEKEKLRQEIEQIEKKRNEILRQEEQRQEMERFEEELKKQKEKQRLEKEKLEQEKEQELIARQRVEESRKKLQEEVNNVYNFTPPVIPNKEKQKDPNKELQKNQELFDKAKKYIDEEEYDAAIGCLRTLIDMNPKIAEFHSYLGLALTRKGWDGYAQAEFKVALHHDPSDKVAIEYYKTSNGTPPEKILGAGNAANPGNDPGKNSGHSENVFFSKIKRLFRG